MRFDASQTFDFQPSETNVIRCLCPLLESEDRWLELDVALYRCDRLPPLAGGRVARHTDSQLVATLRPLGWSRRRRRWGRPTSPDGIGQLHAHTHQGDRPDNPPSETGTAVPLYLNQFAVLVAYQVVDGVEMTTMAIN
jgi:hypothetical protein